MDLVEDKDHFLPRADLPGVGEDDVKIERDDDVPTISGERKSLREERKEGSTGSSAPRGASPAR